MSEEWTYLKIGFLKEKRHMKRTQEILASTNLKDYYFLVCLAAEKALLQRV